MPNPIRTELTAVLTFTLLLFFSTIGVFGEERRPIPLPKIPFAPQIYICYKSSEVLNIDGKADEASWQAAPWTDYFIDIEGPTSRSRALKPAPRCFGTALIFILLQKWKSQTYGQN